MAPVFIMVKAYAFRHEWVSASTNTMQQFDCRRHLDFKGKQFSNEKVTFVKGDYSLYVQLASTSHLLFVFASIMLIFLHFVSEEGLS